MFQLTGAEGTVIAGSLTAVSYFTLARRQKPANDASQEARDLLHGVHDQLGDLNKTLWAHTADDAVNFRELRGYIDGQRKPRRRGWIMPALMVLVKLWMR